MNRIMMSLAEKGNAGFVAHLLGTLVFALVFFAFGMLNAQDLKVPPSQIVLKDTINFGDSAKTGLIHRLLQPVRFHQNKIKRERERMVALIRKLTKEGDMSIDSATVDAIVTDLISLTEYLAANRDSTLRLQDEIQQLILNLDTKAPKQLVDSVQVQLGNVLQGLLDQSKAENVAAQKALAAKLNALRQIQFSCGSGQLVARDTTLGDTVQLSYQKCLSAQTRIFGWHLATMKERYQNYNLNYLTDLILYGYELSANGREANPKTLLGLLDGGILEKNKAYGKRVSLSVYSASASIVSGFLSQSSAQDQFVARVKELISSYGLGGLNIFFERIQTKDAGKLVQLVNRIRSELGSEEGFVLTLSVPAIASSKERAAANAYDFQALNGLVDYYIVQTQRLNITGTTIPFSPSPLYPDAANARGSVVETFGFYTNGKVPIGKLVMTVGYEGISWPMPDFAPGIRASGFGTVMDYATIQQSLVTTLGQPEGAVSGYDPEQASAYLNYGTLGHLRQVWYEDSRSLVDKYTWALDNATGGVAIWGLGADEGYTELWDALGATLIRVDSVVVSSKVLAPKKKLSLMDYLWTYKQDIQWAGINDIYIGDPLKKPEPDYCFFEIYPDRDSLRRLAAANGVTDFWQNRNTFAKYGETDYYSIGSELDCICMIGRWNRYATDNLWASLGFFGLMLIGIIITMGGIQKHGDDWTLRGLFTGIAIGAGLLALVALFFYLFFNTEVGFIGAGSSEVTIWMLIMIFGLGIGAGLLINRLRSAKKYAYRDLP